MTELDEWKQAAKVEAGLRREFYQRALTAEALLQESYAGHRKQKAEIERLRGPLVKALEICRDELEAVSHVYPDNHRIAKALSASRAILAVVGTGKET